jgi:outer membrane receptor protein involved in Fe transport
MTMKMTSNATESLAASSRRRHAQVATVTTLSAAVLTALYGRPALADEDVLQEVVVTATRRALSAQDVPISITAISGAALDQAGIQDIAGLAHSMAGVNYTDKGPFGGVNGSTLIIRGLNSEGTGGQLALASPVVPPVATYVDETPLFVNLRLQDLDHVEVLRGPQGTLYGSGSLGGTIRFVQNAPDPRAFDAKVETGMSKTAHTHSVNDDVTGMLNLPLSDTFAVRLNAGYTDDAGFINQPNLYVLDASGAPVTNNPGNPLTATPVKYGETGVNSYEYRTARVSALWKPSDEFKAQLSYYYQVASAGGFPYVATSPLAYNQPISPLTQPVGTTPPLAAQLYTAPVPAGVDKLSSATNSLEGTRDKVDLFALTLEGDLGFATLTSASSWSHHDNRTHSDLTALYTNFFFYQNFYGQNPRSFVQGQDELDDKSWSQEFRLASKTGGMFDWVGGLFFKHQSTYIQEHEFYPGYNAFYNACAAAGGSFPDTSGSNPSQCGFGEYGPLSGVSQVQGAGTGGPINLLPDQAYIGDFETTFKDLAVFGELTWHATDAWSVTGGTRVFKQDLTQGQQTGLLFDGPAFAANESLGDQWRRALWKINTSYQIDKSNLAYATWSQGFRRGGVNALPPTEAVTDPTTGKNYVTPPALTRLQPDTADNYEIGIKGEAGHRIRYSSAIYDIQWHNIQEGVQLTPLVLPASLNIGEAFSRGLEFELSANLTDHISAQSGYTYDQTKTTSYNALFKNPNVPFFPTPVGGALPGTPKSSVAIGVEFGHFKIAEGDLRYAINAHYQSRILPALSQTIPTVAGYTMVDTRLTYAISHWLGAVYVNNLTNQLGITAYQDPIFYGNRDQAVVSQPRTVGFTLGYSFKGW